ncbi:NfeD family protein [Pseudodesulfovibrio sp. JC047]|uniref:NfeD family protein n=1 Tax=Pseudodesulfovibrio sp. JC047 TaxID=2683199 RepID=UPI0013D5FF26|nr:NfeD family protein [Pseudodesulfovibrio sp. JC047]NDV20302.1 NfeD family protein [Pseudodesulfovibrio sp. JC047]
MDYFNSMENILWLIWLGIGVFFLVAEFVMPAFIVIFFGVGAIIAGISAFFGVSLQMQVLIFVIASLSLILLLRKTMAATFSGQSASEEETDTAIGALCEVVEAIDPPQPGRIKYLGSFWSAQCDVPVAIGDMVRISQRNPKDPNAFIVTKEH